MAPPNKLVSGTGTLLKGIVLMSATALAGFLVYQTIIGELVTSSLFFFLGMILLFLIGFRLFVSSRADNAISSQGMLMLLLAGGLTLTLLIVFKDVFLSFSTVMAPVEQIFSSIPILNSII